jgi:polysaccharide pyruvyl transferase WcaK-like protein
VSTASTADAPGAQSPRLLRATIVNCYPDHNKGSSALASGLVARLRQTGRVGHITAVALPHRIDARSDYRHLNDACPDVEVVPSPLLDQSVQSRKDKAMFTAYMTGRTLSVRAEVALATRRRRHHPALDAILDSDIVLERGGPFFKGMGAPPNPSLLRYAWPLLFARRAGIPYALPGQSVGPLNNPWARRVVRNLFLNAELAAVREDISGRVLEEAGVPAERFTTMLDNAFWTTPRRSSEVDRIIEENGLAGRRFLAVTCRDRRSQEQEDTYLDELAKAIDQLVPSALDAAIIVPNLFNPAGPTHDDRRMSRNLAARLTDNARVHLVEPDLAPDELAALYGEAALVLGHRLHSLILATVGGTPVVGIASSAGPKTVGVLSLLGLSDFVVPIGTITGGDVTERAKAALEGQPGVQQRVQQLRATSDADFDAFVERVARRTSA